jgi:hypothetical protein
MELTQGSETSANYNYNMTPGKYPKEHIQYKKLIQSSQLNAVYVHVCMSVCVCLYVCVCTHAPLIKGCDVTQHKSQIDLKCKNEDHVCITYSIFHLSSSCVWRFVLFKHKYGKNL